jgi:hypothetical protein
MASGSEPESIGHLLYRFRPHCVGISLCGAGAGGYAVCILKRSASVEDIKQVINTLINSGHPYQSMELKVSSARVDNDGLKVEAVSSELARAPCGDIFANHVL